MRRESATKSGTLASPRSSRRAWRASVAAVVGNGTNEEKCDDLMLLVLRVESA